MYIITSPEAGNQERPGSNGRNTVLRAPVKSTGWIVFMYSDLDRLDPTSAIINSENNCRGVNKFPFDFSAIEKELRLKRRKKEKRKLA